MPCTIATTSTVNRLTFPIGTLLAAAENPPQIRFYGERVSDGLGFALVQRRNAEVPLQAQHGIPGKKAAFRCGAQGNRRGMVNASGGPLQRLKQRLVMLA